MFIKPDIYQLLEAARATDIPEGSRGLWYIRKGFVTRPFYSRLPRNGRNVRISPGTYTHLFRYTNATLVSGGEVVMEDTIHELETHLNFMMKARGKVLVTGLGLGCVLRGLLANPNVDCITCLEKSSDVLNLVSPYMPIERLEIIETDALIWTAETSQTFDCAYHDIWSDPDKDDPHLDNLHMRLFMNLKDKAGFQGAWAFNREVRKIMQKGGFPII